MQFRTEVNIDRPSFRVEPRDRMLFVGSCFAENIGRRFVQEKFRATVNPYGTMYNPASVMHTIDRAIKDGIIPEKGIDTAVFTLGTNHVYILKETEEIVDNCQKRPQRLFREEALTVAQCHDYLSKAVRRLREINPETKVIVTVSPIRYAKYGFHGSQLSKATLLLAANQLVESEAKVEYFPAYEIVNDELRDYRFYQPDMLHPSEQAVEYIYERFADTFFSADSRRMTEEWRPIHAALSHRPFNPDSENYQAFLAKAKADEEAFLRKWGV